VAHELGGGHALCRAIGQALRRNPLPVVVPCHRVVAASGLGGYAGAREGAMTSIKRGLIDFEVRVASQDFEARCPSSWFAPLAGC
jgi:O-6-methylguanine DNA methyltransferase